MTVGVELDRDLRVPDQCAHGINETIRKRKHTPIRLCAL